MDINGSVNDYVRLYNDQVINGQLMIVNDYVGPLLDINDRLMDINGYIMII